MSRLSAAGPFIYLYLSLFRSLSEVGVQAANEEAECRVMSLGLIVFHILQNRKTGFQFEVWFDSGPGMDEALRLT
jgi:hypothetical protein